MPLSATPELVKFSTRPHLAAELLDGLVVSGDVGPGLLLEGLHEVLHHALVEVFAAEVRVPVRRQHLFPSTTVGW